MMKHGPMREEIIATILVPYCHDAHLCPGVSLLLSWNLFLLLLFLPTVLDFIDRQHTMYDYRPTEEHSLIMQKYKNSMMWSLIEEHR